MHILKDSILKIGNYNAVIDAEMFSPVIASDMEGDYDTINEEGSNLYIIKPDMITTCSIQNNIGNKFTYCILKLTIPTDNNSIFKYIYTSNYIYFNISLTMSSSNELLTKDEIINSVDNNLVYNYTEQFFVKSKQLMGVTQTHEAYEFTLVSTRWWNFHRNIHYSTKGKKEPIATIIKNTYAITGMEYFTQKGYENTCQLENTSIVYSSSANDNLLSIEKFIKQKLFNLNYTKQKDIDISNNFNCIIAYNRLSGKYYSWIKPSISDLTDENPKQKTSNKDDKDPYPNGQTDIPEFTVAINNSKLTTDFQAVLSDKQYILTTKDEQYLNQRQIVYQTYNYENDTIHYSILSQQNKQKIYVNDNDVNECDLTDNVMYPYNYVLSEHKPAKSIIKVIPDQNESNFSRYVSISEDTSNIVNELEVINFNTNNIVIFTPPQIKYDVGHIIFLKFVNSFTDKAEDVTSYSLYNGYYIIKTINLMLLYNGYDRQTITLSKLY